MNSSSFRQITLHMSTFQKLLNVLNALLVHESFYVDTRVPVWSLIFLLNDSKVSAVYILLVRLIVSHQYLMVTQELKSLLRPTPGTPSTLATLAISIASLDSATASKNSTLGFCSSNCFAWSAAN